MPTSVKCGDGKAEKKVDQVLSVHHGDYSNAIGEEEAKEANKLHSYFDCYGAGNWSCCILLYARFQRRSR